MYPIMDPGDTNNPEMPKGTDKKKIKEKPSPAKEPGKGQPTRAEQS